MIELMFRQNGWMCTTNRTANGHESHSTINDALCALIFRHKQKSENSSMEKKNRFIHCSLAQDTARAAVSHRRDHSLDRCACNPTNATAVGNESKFDVFFSFFAESPTAQIGHVSSLVVCWTLFPECARPTVDHQCREKEIEEKKHQFQIDIPSMRFILIAFLHCCWCNCRCECLGIGFVEIRSMRESRWDRYKFYDWNYRFECGAASVMGRRWMLPILEIDN